MSSTALPGAVHRELGTDLTGTAVVPEHGAEPRNLRDAGRFIRRRASLQQGMALETLGHAVEYLVDSRMFENDERKALDDQEAIQTLMRLSRAVFAECPEVIPLRRRMRLWLSQTRSRVPVLRAR